MWDEESMRWAIYDLLLDYRDILWRAIEHEEKHANDPNYLGWKWYDVKAHPAQLMKLVNENLIEISFRNSKGTYYKLVDRELTKKCLEFFRSREKVMEWLKKYNL